MRPGSHLPRRLPWEQKREKVLRYASRWRRTGAPHLWQLAPLADPWLRHATASSNFPCHCKQHRRASRRPCRVTNDSGRCHRLQHLAGRLRQKTAAAVATRPTLVVAVAVAGCSTGLAGCGKKHPTPSPMVAAAIAGCSTGLDGCSKNSYSFQLRLSVAAKTNCGSSSGFSWL